MAPLRDERYDYEALFRGCISRNSTLTAIVLAHGINRGASTFGSAIGSMGGGFGGGASQAGGYTLGAAPAGGYNYMGSSLSQVPGFGGV